MLTCARAFFFQLSDLTFLFNLSIYSKIKVRLTKTIMFLVTVLGSCSIALTAKSGNMNGKHYVNVRVRTSVRVYVRVCVRACDSSQTVFTNVLLN